MNLFTNLHNSISSICISILLFMHTYKYIILYMLKKCLILMRLFMNTLLNLTHLIVDTKFWLELGSIHLQP